MSLRGPNKVYCNGCRSTLKKGSYLLCGACVFEREDYVEDKAKAVSRQNRALKKKLKSITTAVDKLLTAHSTCSDGCLICEVITATRGRPFVTSR